LGTDWGSHRNFLQIFHMLRSKHAKDRPFIKGASISKRNDVASLQPIFHTTNTVMEGWYNQTGRVNQGFVRRRYLDFSYAAGCSRGDTKGASRVATRKSNIKTSRKLADI